MDKVCIIIPGIGGSKIYCNCSNNKRPIKLYPKLVGNLNKHFYNPNCKSITKPLKSLLGISVYSNLENRIKNHHKIEYYSYDWRKTPLSIAKELYIYLENCKRSSTETINIIGHSNGGYIIRILIEYLNYPRDCLNYVFICGTPFYGSVDKTLYNSEMKIYRKLHDNKIEAPIKLMCLSGRDVNKIFTIYKETLLYFIPSFVFRDKTTKFISEYINVPESSVVVAKALHSNLGKFNIVKTIFYFNTSIRKKVYRLIEQYELKNVYFNIIPRAKAMKRIGDQIYLKELTYSDNLIIPSIQFPRNSTFIFDEIKLNHGLIMNSLYFTHALELILNRGELIADFLN